MNQEEILIKMGADISDMKKQMAEAENVVARTSKKFEFLGMEMRELKKSARELGHEFPVLGKLALAAITPIGGAVALAAMSVGYFKEQIDKLNESLDKTAEHNADASATKTLEAREQAVINASKEMERYEMELRKATSTEGDFQKAIDNSIAALERKAHAEQEVANLQAALGKSQLDEMLNAGLISEKQHSQQVGELEKQAARESFEREKKRREDVIGLQKQAASHAASSAASLDEKARKALAASGLAGARAASSAGRREEAEEFLKGHPTLFQHNKEVQEFDERQNSWWRNLLGVNLINRGIDAGNRTRLAGEAEAINKGQSDLKNAKLRADKDKEEADKAKIEADELASKSKEAATKAKDACDKLSEAQTQQAEWLDQQTKIQKTREQNIDNATRAALSHGLSGVAGVTADDRRGYMPTIQEMATSGHWVNYRMSGAGRTWFEHDSPFAADAQQMLRLQGFAQFDYLHGNNKQGDLDVLNIKNLRAKMIREGAIQAGPQDVAEDFKKFLLDKGIKIIPILTD